MTEQDTTTKVPDGTVGLGAGPTDLVVNNDSATPDVIVSQDSSGATDPEPDPNASTDPNASRTDPSSTNIELNASWDPNVSITDPCGTAIPGGGTASPGTAPTQQASPSVPDSPAFHHGAEIDFWFIAKTRSSFVGWLNATQSKQGGWSGVAIGGSDAEARFLQIWGNIAIVYRRDAVNLSEVLVLMSVVINETGGLLAPVSERVGTSTHRGIAYALYAVPKSKKASYNAAPWNALASFNNVDFPSAHGAKSSAEMVRNTQDLVWSRTTYPKETFPTSTDPALSGLILEADFYKFRGRGLIQTTFRRGYMPIIGFVRGHAGGQAMVVKYMSLWAGTSADVVAHRSSNKDWDAPFQPSDYVVPCQAIRWHNQGGGDYLKASSDRAVLAG